MVRVKSFRVLPYSLGLGDGVSRVGLREFEGIVSRVEWLLGGDYVEVGVGKVVRCPASHTACLRELRRRYGLLVYPIKFPYMSFEEVYDLRVVAHRELIRLLDGVEEYGIFLISKNMNLITHLKSPNTVPTHLIARFRIRGRKGRHYQGLLITHTTMSFDKVSAVLTPENTT